MVVTRSATGITVDLTRCQRCHKRPRGKLALENFDTYAPFCSYHCQEWARLEAARRHLDTLQERQATP